MYVFPLVFFFVCAFEPSSLEIDSCTDAYSFM